MLKGEVTVVGALTSGQGTGRTAVGRWMGDGLEDKATAHRCLTARALQLLLAIVMLMAIVMVVGVVLLLLLLLRNHIRYERFESTHVRHRR